jgi:thiaminase
MSFFERLKTEASAEWRAYTEHPFTNGLADGSLAEAAFRHYLVQDYLFLTEFARAYALSVYKSPKLADMREAAAGLSAILDIEMNLHVKLCAGWGLSPSDLEQTPPAVEMLAYILFVGGASPWGLMILTEGNAQMTFQEAMQMQAVDIRKLWQRKQRRHSALKERLDVG